MRVYVHGNCQAPAIATLLREVSPNWEVAAYEVHSQKILDEISLYRDAVTQADVIISQPVHDGYRDRDDLSLSWVRANAKRDVPLVMFPSMFFDGQLTGWRSVSIPGYGMPYQDMLVLHCVALGMNAARITTIVADENVYPESFIEQEMGLSLAEMKRREDAERLDVLLSPFLEEHCRRARLFHVINHPYRQTLTHIANGILKHLGYSLAIPLYGIDLIPLPHVPLPASVQRFMRKHANGKETWDIAETHKFHINQERLTRAEYIFRQVDHLRSFPREELMKQLREPHVLPFLQRLAGAAPGIPGIDIWRKVT
jgi:Polysaccharide biosynthesis enzyme WcbI